MDIQDPLETHRFRQNEISHSNLNKFRNLLKYFKEKHPEIIAATVYGSQVLGRSTETSDIDSYVFIDAKKAGLDNNPLATMATTTGDSDWEKINQEIGIPLRTELERQLDMTQEKTKGVKVRLISETRIKNELDKIIEYEKKLFEAKRQGQSYRESKPKTNINFLFLMQIGTGLDVYRSQVLERLKSEGEVGQKIWENTIIFGVQFLENARLKGINRTSKELFPKTIDSAFARFNIKN